MSTCTQVIFIIIIIKKCVSLVSSFWAVSCFTLFLWFPGGHIPAALYVSWFWVAECFWFLLLLLLILDSIMFLVSVFYFAMQSVHAVFPVLI